VPEYPTANTFRITFNAGAPLLLMKRPAPYDCRAADQTFI
jgi:hypothetical protein